MYAIFRCLFDAHKRISKYRVKAYKYAVIFCIRPMVCPAFPYRCLRLQARPWLCRASFAESGCTVPGLSSLWALLTACLSLYRAVCASRLRACLAPRRCFRASFVLPCSAFFFRAACHLLCTRLFRRYGKAGASSWRHGSLAFFSRHALGCAGASFAESGCTVPEQSSLWASLTACLSLYRAVCASRLRACLASPVWMPSPSDTPLAVLEPTA